MLPRLIRYNYHRPGKGTTVFDEWLIEERDDVLITLLPAYQGEPVLVGERGVLEPGAPIVWFLFPGEWYGVGRFHLADGTFTGWYTNLTEPVVISSDRWDGTDLFLDHWVSIDGVATWLDEVEFSEAKNAGLVSAGQLSGVARARDLVSDATADGRWPPELVRRFDLAKARAALEGQSG